MTKYGHFDAQLLNQSAAEINATIANGTVTSKGFMFATLTAFNATGTDTGDGVPGTDGVSNTSNSGGGNGPNTSLAMSVHLGGYWTVCSEFSMLILLVIGSYYMLSQAVCRPCFAS